jgi:hypothetical protein
VPAASPWRRQRRRREQVRRAKVKQREAERAKEWETAEGGASLRQVAADPLGMKRKRKDDAQRVRRSKVKRQAEAKQTVGVWCYRCAGCLCCFCYSVKRQPMHSSNIYIYEANEEGGCVCLLL